MEKQRIKGLSLFDFIEVASAATFNIVHFSWKKKLWNIFQEKETSSYLSLET